MSNIVVDGLSSEPLLITAGELANLLHISVRSLWRLRSAQVIPEPVRLGGTTVRWRYDEVREWISAGCPQPPADDNDRPRK
jgi:predicted DNA-binding transcriptional regulator AlpA